MVDPIIGGAVIFLVLTGGTKTGRSAVRNAGTSAYKATGWKTPKTAIVHYSGRAGDKTGAAFAATARKTRNAAVKLAERRWDKRAASDDPPGSRPPVRRIRPDQPASDPVKAPAVPGPADTGPAGTAPAGPPPAWGHPPGPAAGAAGSAPGDPRIPDPFTSSVVHDDDTYTLKPTTKFAAWPATGPAAGPAVPSSGGTTAPDRRTMPAHHPRYQVEFEKPTTDAEFLESCVTLADLLRHLAKSVEEWAGEVSSLGLPKQVTAPLDAVSEGIEGASSAVTRSASTFADLFEDARDIAARGMKFTGEDAA